MERLKAFLTNSSDPGNRVPHYSLPLSVNSSLDPAPARWLESRVKPIRGSNDGVRLQSIVPGGFPDYARILHPARALKGDAPVRWAEIAARTGRVMHPQVQFGRLAGSDDPYGHPDWVDHPRVGQLPDTVAPHLVATLKRHTSTPERCYLCVWEGYGSFEEHFPEAARIVLPDRTYLMFVGPIDAVLELVDHRNMRFQPPNLWWPADRAWCCATEIDFVETYVGGSVACVDEILACPELETFRVSPDARVDFFGDTINV